MKQFFKYYTPIALSLAIAVTSCKKSFLDDPRPTNQVSENDIFSSASNIRAYFTGIYNIIRSDMLSHDSDGAKSYDLAYEVMGDDIMTPFGNWYSFDYEIDNSRSVYRRTRFTWNFHYKVINNTNVIIAGLGEAPIPDNAKLAFEAEARAIRAWAYFNLIRAYQHAYSKDKSALGVPLYTVPTSADNEGNPRSSVEEVYALIVSDLDFAVQHLTGERAFKYMINKSVAHGIFARVYLTMEEWEKAEQQAFAALEGYGVATASYTAANIQQAFTPADYDKGFNSYDASEWLWGLPLRNDQAMYYRSLFSFFDHDRTDGYKNFYVNNTFVNRFSDTDVRKLFATKNGYYITTKFRDLNDLSGHLVMMRSPELVLVIAEARAELNDLDNAKVVLHTLQVNRDPNALISANDTKQALIEEILVERRKELYGEIGVMAQDIKRKQLDLVRTGNHPAAYLNTYPANYTHFIFQIPQEEMDANEHIAPGDQNP
ncbi:RagB/SusD family nutrient uptake outer membrane protein [Olivibacter sitiensis]|uniref:RagB/SusD family nutrient uptake outer membrane protein n=1 Tax=Olivibacter sitiensis TaxID=376470 RepID=UPI0003F813CF|nr:RagB/SusD family nutrient uptake outer membrane protein [Olivibacter sitiensis]